MKILGLMVFIVLFSSVMGTAHADGRNVHSFTMNDIDGKSVDLSIYKGKALLIVNTASKCGFTKQYAGMQKLYETYKDKGFEVLAFPANNFMGQEPGTNEEIKAFCSLKFKTSFPLFAKSSVKGEDINPLYKYLTEESPFKGAISWNFNKFLVNTDGEVVSRFDSGVDLMDPVIISEVERILPK